jgi:hypothetical protein
MVARTTDVGVNRYSLLISLRPIETTTKSMEADIEHHRRRIVLPTKYVREGKLAGDIVAAEDAVESAWPGVKGREMANDARTGQTEENVWVWS